MNKEIHLRNALLVLTSQLYVLVAGGILMILLARWLAPQHFGQFQLILSSVVILSAMVDFGLTHSVPRFIAEFTHRGGGGVKSVLFSGLVLKLVLLGTACLLVYLLRAPLLSWANLGEVEGYFGLALLLLALFNLYNYFLKLFEGFLRFKAIPVVTFLKNTSDLIVSLTLVYLGFGLMGAISGRLVSLLVAVLLAGVLLFLMVRKQPGGRFSFNTTHARDILSYGWRLAAVDAGSRVLSNADRLILNGFLGSVVVGIYAVPQRIVELSMILGISVAAAVSPSFAGVEHREDRIGQFSTSVRLLLSFYMLLGILLLVFSEQLIELLFTDQYLGSVPVLRMMALILPVLGVSPVASLTLNYIGYAGVRARVVTMAAVLSIALNLVLIPRFGMMGAAFAFVLSHLLYVVVQFMIVGRALRLPASFVAVVFRVLTAGAFCVAIGLVPEVWDSAPFPPWTFGIVAGLVYVLLLHLQGVLRFSEMRMLFSLLDRNQWRAS